MTRKQVLENRIKFAKELQNPNREKYTGYLENINNSNERCCLGHGCQIFQLERNELLNGIHYGKVKERYYAPKELVNLLGLNNDMGSFKEDFCYEGSHYHSLAILNDESDLTTQGIGKLLETMVEGGSGTPYRPLTDYEDEL